MINPINRSEVVGTSTVVVSEAKLNNVSERVRLVITNTSTAGQKISVAVGTDAVSGVGLVLSPGGFVAWEKQGGQPIQQNRVNVVADAVAGSVAIYEEVAQ